MEDRPMSFGNPVIDALIVVGQALWFMFPAMTTGSFAVLLGGGAPIDGYRKDKKGIRLLGDGKSWAGLGWGILGGVSVGTAMVIIRSFAPAEAQDLLTDFTPEGPSVLGFLGPIIALCFGAMMGDLLFSFGKRRKGLQRGARAPLVDQLDFVVGSWLFLLAFYPTWTLHTFRWEQAIAILILIPGIHLLTNVIAHKLGKKKEPW
jgi:CDP-2,3-bis-(O-geranylgeranyl)-sn-glycerol synthase